MDVRLSVSPQGLTSQANEISAAIRRVSQIWGNLETVVNRTRGYWEGDASQIHMQYFRDNRKEAEEIIRRLQKYPDELLQMAGLYVEADNRASELTSALPNIVF